MMVLTASSIQEGFEPIPGYVLRNKLGAGGYGEVWLADAPGGLKKAIKFVHGAIEGDRAAGELKSLQRIRQVNHPFILSLERIEVIDGQLIIVTELAGGSLHDRYMEFRAKGFIGIAKEKLIGYIKDTADGLDFLCQQHDLQHLDVKPANLLLVADRVKVADFGLIKDIQSNSLSVMGGLTPTYAAPEMFDGRPGRFSDQYSLAIVYQELLSGTLPFRGRTTAQLANEHLHKAPNLEAIPLLERPILSKALSKKPQMRFNDCREFINAIEKAQTQSVVQDEKKATTDRSHSPKRMNPARRPAARPYSNSDRTANRLDGNTSHSTQSPIIPVSKPQIVEVLPWSTPSSHSDAIPDSTSIPISSARKSLIIGLGATGAQSAMAMRQKIFHSTPQRLQKEQMKSLIIDSDQSTMEMALDPSKDWRIPDHSAVLIPLKSPQYYRLGSNDFPQLSRRWVYNIPRSMKTEGVRPLGMLALLDNAEIVFDALQESILEIAKSNGLDQLKEPIEVRIVSSAHGGTGSAIASEIGFMVRQLSAEFEIPMHVELILTCASPYGVSSTDLTTASALACLNEINHYFETEGLHPQIDQIPLSGAINQPPFDHVSLVHGGQCGNAHDWENTIAVVSDYLWACNETELGCRIAWTREESKREAIRYPDQSWTNWLGAVSSRPLEISSNITPEADASRLCLRAILPWLSAMNDLLSKSDPKEPDRPVADEKFIEKMDFFVQDMFRNNHWTAQAWVRECMAQLSPNRNENASSAEPADANRIAGTQCDSHLNHNELADLEQVCDQLALDIDAATKTISNLVDVTQTNLADWLTRRWLTSPQAFSKLRHVLRLIASKFSVNANSLFVVSQKLAEQYDEFLDTINAHEQSHSLEIENQLHTLALEARFHSLGAKMLARMAEHMSFLEDLWRNECKLLHAEVCKWVDELAMKLGLSLDNSAQSQWSIAALMKTDDEDATNKEVRKLIRMMASSRLKGVVETIPASATDIQPTLLTFASVFQAAIRLCTPPQPPVGDLLEDRTIVTARLTSDSHKTTPVPDLSQPRMDSTLASQAGVADMQNLEFEIDSTRPYFVESGGAVRNIVVAPKTILESLDSTQRATMEIKNVALFSSPGGQQTTILCLGERLVLSDLIDRVWMPSAEIWNLATRIASRVDVDWLPIRG